MTPRNAAAFAALVRESARVGWPVRFQTDLTSRDHQALSRRREGIEFVWVLYRDGTHLVFPDERVDGGRSPAHVMPGYIEQTFGAENLCWYAWHGEQLARLPDAYIATEWLRAPAAALSPALLDDSASPAGRRSPGAPSAEATR